MTSELGRRRLFVHVRRQGGAGCAWLEKTIMPSHLKDRVRARREKTGESHQQALRHVRAEVPESPDLVRSRPRTIADTAFSIAVVRAEESARPEAERLFTDPFASIFAAGGAHAAESTQRFLDLPFFREGVRVRTRYLDDAVRDAICAGLDQIVLLGAGFDARGLRMPEIAERRASVWEIDTPEQLARKRRLLTRAGIGLPRRVRHVPFAFDAPAFGGVLTSALEAKGFRCGRPAIFVWEGVIGYIDDAAIDESLRFTAAAGGEGTRVAFTFGESSFDPDTAADRTRRAGFTSCEEIAGDALWCRYGSGDPHPHAFVMKVATAIV
jgi:methyltransferase (TIGR00027 family)